MNYRIILAVLPALMLIVLSMPLNAASTPDSPEVLIGERLFKETRFAQFFFAQSSGNVNAVDVSGDPVLDFNQTLGQPLTGAFSGQTMSCRACHMEAEHIGTPGGGVRTYADFARRSSIPDRGDGNTLTTRNSPPLVDASLTRSPFFLHFDGEFVNAADLVIGGFTGRNFGWLLTENATAVKHVAKVIREDDGLGELARNFGGSYAKVLAGASTVPARFRLPKRFRINVAASTDAQILTAIGNLVGLYMKSLVFHKDASGAYDATPYDLFLIRNNLPRKPITGESKLLYSRRLRDTVNLLADPIFITPADGTFQTHSIPFQFGPDELEGLKLFLAEPQAPGPFGGVGNCIACHTAPEFTDFLFHNTGTAQFDYDSVHGEFGAFARLQIPTAAQRQANPASAFPPSAAHPNFAGKFREIPSRDDPSRVDLGVWNTLGNPDMPKSQRDLRRALKTILGDLPEAQLVDATIGMFKTPGLRDLGHSQPYFHDGQVDTLQDVVNFYIFASDFARNNQIRSVSPHMRNITLTLGQGAQIARFMESLNEDFEH